MKEEYINMRNLNRIDMGFMYKYFRENGGNLDINQFNQVFMMTNMNDVLEFLDHKFELTLLFNANRGFIKVVC